MAIHDPVHDPIRDPRPDPAADRDDSLSLKALIRELVSEVTHLIRQELRLAHAESGEKLAQAQRGLIAIAAGLLLAVSALLVLLQAVVAALAEFMEPWLASAIVGVVVAVLALIFVKQGERALRPISLVPERTMRSMQHDADMVAEKMR